MRTFVIVFITAMLLLLLSACGTSRDQNNTVSLDPQTSELPPGNSGNASDGSMFEISEESGTVTAKPEEREEEMKGYVFSAFTNVKITGNDPDSLSNDALAVLYAQAKYCQAMTDADIDTMRELVSEDMIFTHMSGRQQSREEYFADIADGSLNYFTVGIPDPVIKVNGDTATITYTSVLNASAYGARGTYRIKGTHYYEKRGGTWIVVNGREDAD